MDAIEISKRLTQIFSEFQNKPIVFAGSGVTRRYLNLPSWEELLRGFANKIQPGSKFAFRGYGFRANKIIVDEQLPEKYTYPVIAELIEMDYNDKFFTNESFENTIKEKYTEIIENGISPFKIAISDYLSSVKEFTEIYELEHKTFGLLFNKASSFITTNYDNFIEEHFPNYTVLVGQEDLFNNHKNSIGNIFKIHGSISNPNSIIITKNDYVNFQNKLTFLSAKLQTLFIEHPIIFIGYSINDENICEIIQNIKLCLNEENSLKLSKQLIFIEYTKKKEKQDIISTEIEGLQMTKIKLCDYNLIYKAFDSILDTIDVSTLRKIEDKITQLVSSTDGTIERVYATSLEDKELSDNDLAIYIGHNSSVFDLGYSSIRLINICEDVLFNKKGYDANGIIDHTILSQKSNFYRSKIPLHKYLNHYKGDIDEWYSRSNCIIQKLNDLYNKSEKQTRLYKHPITNLNQITGTGDELNKVIYNLYLSLRKLDLKEVKEYIKSIWPRRNELRTTTYLTKIICAVDLSENKKEP